MRSARWDPCLVCTGRWRKAGIGSPSSERESEFVIGDEDDLEEEKEGKVTDGVDLGKGDKGVKNGSPWAERETTEATLVDRVEDPTARGPAVHIVKKAGPSPFLFVFLCYSFSVGRL